VKIVSVRTDVVSSDREFQTQRPETVTKTQLTTVKTRAWRVVPAGVSQIDSERFYFRGAVACFKTLIRHRYWIQSDSVTYSQWPLPSVAH